MNLTKLKNYAPDARKNFIEAVTRRAGVLGIRADRVDDVSETGDIALIGGQPFPLSVVSLRKKLVDRIKAEGFGAVMEAMAYTWFNRFVAFRFMELHSYFDHGYRVLSHPQGGPIPEILQHAEHVTLDGLDRDEVIRLKLAGNKDEELYRLLILAQCQELHRVLPDIFSRLDDVTILLLPDNLLNSDSLIRLLAAASDAEDWQQVEILGWLYQFYISERKDQVMARKSAVPTEDIPAVTQLFTPHWIVRYLVENSLGRLWLLNRPGSRLREHMPYYIEGENTAPGGSPAETDFLKITKPEEIRLLDPAVGSGHMLTYAFDLLTLIYEEEGYAPTEIPALILRHNLHGLEICPRAAQLAELALVFKAREKSRRFFQPEHIVRPVIIELREVRFAENELRDYIRALGLGDLFHQPLLKLLHQFEEAKNFGSLIQPCLDERTIAEVRRAIEGKDLGGQLFLRETHLKVLRVLEQAEALTQRYHVVVANPPYMGSGAMNVTLKDFVEEWYPAGKPDLYGCFILRLLNFVVPKGAIGLITIPNWMFLGGFEDLRKELLARASITSLVQNGRGLWGADFGSCSFCITNQPAPGLSGVFRRLFTKASEVSSPDELSARFLDQKAFPVFRATANDFRAIPGTPIAYWISPKIRHAFATNRSLGAIAEPRVGLQTGSNETFVRSWVELSQNDIFLRAKNGNEAKESGKKWFPYNKGGAFRKWFGNAELVVLWENDGEEIKNFKNPQGKLRSRPQNTGYFFRPSVSWSKVSIGAVAFRYFPEGFIFDVAGCSLFPMGKGDSVGLLGFLNSKVAASVLAFLSPTMNYEVGHVAQLPVPQTDPDSASAIVAELISSAKADWDNFETSWDFRDQPLLRPGLKGATLEASWRNWEAQSTAAIRRMQELETENNRLFIAAYGLDGELQPAVPEEQITLARADARRDMAAFLSYAVGCMMGRYSLDQPGLILADAGATVQDYEAKVPNPTFAPDEDGIVPLTDRAWFDDDAAQRVEEFLRVTFGPDTLEQNLQFLASSLGPNSNETPHDTLRRYLTDDFYKNHLSSERSCGYKNRPIYWLFSSGREKAFQCLVYLHRYQLGTLARMRTEYVIPLQGKLNSRIAHLEEEKTHATSSAQRNKLQKEQDKHKKQQTELVKFDEQLRHYSDQRIALDLDDGVKVNYAKFGPLMAEAKKVCGTKEED